MLVIRNYWSLDFKRDLSWTAINELHKSWDMQRQSERWSRADIADRQRKAYYAKLTSVTGDKLYDHIIKTAGLSPLTEYSNVRKDVAAGEKLVKGLD